MVVDDVDDDNDVGIDDGLGLAGTIVLDAIEVGPFVLDSPDEAPAQISSEKQNIPPGHSESLQVGAVSHVKSSSLRLDAHFF